MYWYSVVKTCIKVFRLGGWWFDVVTISLFRLILRWFSWGRPNVHSRSKVFVLQRLCIKIVHALGGLFCLFWRLRRLQQQLTKSHLRSYSARRNQTSKNLTHVRGTMLGLFFLSKRLRRQEHQLTKSIHQAQNFLLPFRSVLSHQSCNDGKEAVLITVLKILRPWRGADSHWRGQQVLGLQKGGAQHFLQVCLQVPTRTNVNM